MRLTRPAPRSPVAWLRAPAQSRRGASSCPGAERAGAPARVPRRARPPAVSATRAAPAAQPSRGQRGASWRRWSAASAGPPACRRGRGGRRGTVHAPARGCSRAAAVGWHAGPATAASAVPMAVTDEARVSRLTAHAPCCGSEGRASDRKTFPKPPTPTRTDSAKLEVAAESSA
eukprot:scaffold77959_cov64-Phaeocystis_antarctica.AAC.8